MFFFLEKKLDQGAKERLHKRVLQQWRSFFIESANVVIAYKEHKDSRKFQFWISICKLAWEKKNEYFGLRIFDGTWEKPLAGSNIQIIRVGRLNIKSFKMTVKLLKKTYEIHICRKVLNREVFVFQIHILGDMKEVLTVTLEWETRTGKKVKQSHTCITNLFYFWKLFVQNNAEYNNIMNIIKINTKKTSTFQF